MIPANVIEDIRYRCDIESVISSYVSLKRAGSNLKGLCPFHSEKTPSFTVYPETQSFYCFGCGAGGLVRAYGAAAKNAIDAAGLAVFEPYAVMKIVVTYSDYQRLTVALAKLGASEDHCDFGENVTVLCAIEAARAEEVAVTVSEMTYGKGKFTVLGYEERASRVK